MVVVVVGFAKHAHHFSRLCNTTTVGSTRLSSAVWRILVELVVVVGHHPEAPPPQVGVQVSASRALAVTQQGPPGAGQLLPAPREAERGKAGEVPQAAQEEAPPAVGQVSCPAVEFWLEDRIVVAIAVDRVEM